MENERFVRQLDFSSLFLFGEDNQKEKYFFPKLHFKCSLGKQVMCYSTEEFLLVYLSPYRYKLVKLIRTTVVWLFYPAFDLVLAVK